MKPLLAMLGLAIVCGCGESKPEPSDRRPIDPKVIDIAADEAVLQAGSVGVGEHAEVRTYVLVDASNTAEHDVIATVTGTISGGISLGKQSLRIPAGGVRTFALVADREPPENAPARIETLTVESAAVPRHPPGVVVENGHVFTDGDRVVAQASIHNTATHPVQAVVAAGFYDASGRIMKRPFSAITIDGGQRFPVQFVGPDGSRRAYIFVGETVYLLNTLH